MGSLTNAFFLNAWRDAARRIVQKGNSLVIPTAGYTVEEVELASTVIRILRRSETEQLRIAEIIVLSLGNRARK